MQRVRRAIVVVDVVESVRLMQLDEAGVIDRWRRFVNQVRTEVLPAHGGRLVKSLGDGMLLEFSEPQPAIAAVHRMHALAASLRGDDPAGTAVWLRTGVHSAEVVVDELDIYGTGVNLAARLAGLAGPGETVISLEVRESLLADFDADLEDLGDCYLKHIAQPVRAFRVAPLSSRGQASGFAAAFEVLLPTLAVLPFVPYDSASDAPPNESLAWLQKGNCLSFGGDAMAVRNSPRSHCIGAPQRRHQSFRS